MKHVLCSRGSGIDEKVRSVNRSWTPDSFFSLGKPIHREGVRGKMFRENVRIPQHGGADFLFCPRAQNTPATPLLSASLSICLSVNLSVRPSVQPPARPPIHSSIH